MSEAKSLITAARDIIYIVGIVVALVLSYTSLEKRISMLEKDAVTKSELYDKFDELKLYIKTEIEKTNR